MNKYKSHIILHGRLYKFDSLELLEHILKRYKVINPYKRSLICIFILEIEVVISEVKKALESLLYKGKTNITIHPCKLALYTTEKMKTIDDSNKFVKERKGVFTSYKKIAGHEDYQISIEYLKTYKYTRLEQQNEPYAVSLTYESLFELIYIEVIRSAATGKDKAKDDKPLIIFGVFNKRYFFNYAILLETGSITSRNEFEININQINISVNDFSKINPRCLINYPSKFIQKQIYGNIHQKSINYERNDIFLHNLEYILSTKLTEKDEESCKNENLFLIKL